MSATSNHREAAPASAQQRVRLTMTHHDLPNRSHEMNLMHEELARAHRDARLRQAREQRLSSSLHRARKLALRAERASQQARLLLARAL